MTFIVLKRLSLCTFLRRRHYSTTFAMETVEAVVSIMEKFAPLHLAESWDNVGLLVKPMARSDASDKITRILLTNDLTEDVLDEGIAEKVNLIVSYHPPIFSPMKRLSCNNWKDRIIMKCLENKIALYSPHTAWDAIKGGVNDWLAEGIGCQDVRPITNSEAHIGCNTHVVSLDISKELLENRENKVAYDKLLCVLDTDLNIKPYACKSETVDKLHVRFICSKSSLAFIHRILGESQSLLDYLTVVKQEKISLYYCGMGRICTLSECTTLHQLTDRIKSFLNLSHVQLAVGKQAKRCGGGDDVLVSTVALCAGSGGQVLRNVAADVYVSGEMSHHDVLDAVSNGVSVILCGHSNTERGFLKHFAPKLKAMLENKVEVLVSKVDSDPLVII